MYLDLVIVDDSAMWLSIAKKLAENHPLVKKVTVFDDTIDAWIYLQKCVPNAVMTDIEMPGMNGLSFVQMFGKKLPFISSSTKKGYALHANALGCSNFLKKPFTKTDFDLAIRRLYDGITGEHPKTSVVNTF